MTKTIMVAFSKHEFRELTKGPRQSHLHTAPECRHQLAIAKCPTGITGLIKTIYRHAHHHDHRQNSRGYFLTIDLGVCSSSNLLGQ
jgi:hypothetical protein